MSISPVDSSFYDIPGMPSSEKEKGLMYTDGDSFVSEPATDEGDGEPAPTPTTDQQMTEFIKETVIPTVKQTNPAYPTVFDPMNFALTLLAPLEKATNKDVLIEGMTNLVSDARDANGNKLFNTRDKARDFLRTLAYPKTRDHYKVPKSLYRAMNHIDPVKLSPLMKRTLKSMSRF